MSEGESRYFINNGRNEITAAEDREFFLITSKANRCNRVKEYSIDDFTIVFEHYVENVNAAGDGALLEQHRLDAEIAEEPVDTLENQEKYDCERRWHSSAEGPNYEEEHPSDKPTYFGPEEPDDDFWSDEDTFDRSDGGDSI